MSTSSTNKDILLLQSISKVFNGYVILALIAIGTIGNVLNIIVFLRHKTLRQMSNCAFLITFFVSNLISLWASRFQRAVLAITGVDLLVGSIFYCKFRWLFGRWSYNMSFTCICLSSVDRFLNTSRSECCQRLITFKRAVVITIVISLEYLIIFMPDAIYYSGYQCTASSSDRAMYQQFIVYYNLIMTNSIPPVTLGIFCLLTWYNLLFIKRRKSNRLFNQLNRMMMAEFSVVFFSSIPNFLYNIYAQVTQSTVKSDLRVAHENIWRNVFVTLSFSLNVGTFYIYFLMSSAYRRKVKAIFCCRKHN
ncbi:unnamed protein product [Adineta ricciae]|uniref:G-protein coupled receptors family 1 profile domain-containing protein n=1 Tax=Adineta ricciae TaxID=249248 RepID=A0A815AHG4_ADIRI|nr:unnamed protein product [Adineta ricciae]CAF1300570.1 unnamed protein product [Adineta ricciae]